MEVSEIDFSLYSKSFLFKSNILRYRALASLKMFEYGLAEEPNKDDENNLENEKHILEYLTTAIQCLKSAESMYEVYSPTHN